jgi:predicted XRE-type DNA-binding protein
MISNTSDLDYLEKEIKNNLINKDFIDWNKDSIYLLLSVYENKEPEYKDFQKINLVLLDRYISWYKKVQNRIIINSYEQYSLEDLEYISSLIKYDIIPQNYNKILYKMQNIPFYYYILDYIKSIIDLAYSDFGFGVLVIYIIIMFKYLSCFFIMYNNKNTSLYNSYQYNLNKQLYEDNLKQEQIKQEQIKQEQIKQEQIKQEQIKQEQIKQEQINKPLLSNFTNNPIFKFFIDKLVNNKGSDNEEQELKTNFLDESTFSTNPFMKILLTKFL